MTRNLIFVIISIVIVILSALLQACASDPITSPKPVVEPNNSPAGTISTASPTIPQTSSATNRSLFETMRTQGDHYEIILDQVSTIVIAHLLI